MNPDSNMIVPINLSKNLSNGAMFRHMEHNYPPGKLSGLHCHNHFELVYVVSGALAFVVEDRKYILKPGDLILARPSKYHYLQVLTPGPYDRYILHFNPALHGLECALDLPETVEVVNLLKNPVASGLFSRMEYYYTNLEQPDFEAIFPLLVKELFFNLKICSTPNLQEETTLSPIMTRALEYINANLFSITGIEEIAQALYISPTYLFYLFRTSLQRSPKRYITDKRLLAAQRLIRAGTTPTDAYKACGFQDYSAFYRSYRSFFGHAPSQEYTDEGT